MIAEQNFKRPGRDIAVGSFFVRMASLDLGRTSLLFAGMEIRHFRQFARQRCSGAFAIGLMMLWGWLLTGGAGDDYTTDESTTDRYVEHELMFLDSGRELIFWIRAIF